MNTVSIVIAVLLAAAVLAAFLSAGKHKGGCGGCRDCEACGRSCRKKSR